MADLQKIADTFGISHQWAGSPATESTPFFPGFGYSPTGKLTLDGAEWRYIPLEAVVKLWTDVAGRPQLIRDFVGNPVLLATGRLIEIPQAIGQRVHASDWMGTVYRYSYPHVGLMLTEAEYLALLNAGGVPGTLDGAYVADTPAPDGFASFFQHGPLAEIAGAIVRPMTAADRDYLAERALGDQTILLSSSWNSGVSTLPPEYFAWYASPAQVANRAAWAAIYAEADYIAVSPSNKYTVVVGNSKTGYWVRTAPIGTDSTVSTIDSHATDLQRDAANNGQMGWFDQLFTAVVGGMVLGGLDLSSAFGDAAATEAAAVDAWIGADITVESVAADSLAAESAALDAWYGTDIPVNSLPTGLDTVASSATVSANSPATFQGPQSMDELFDFTVTDASSSADPFATTADVNAGWTFESGYGVDYYNVAGIGQASGAASGSSLSDMFRSVTNGIRSAVSAISAINGTATAAARPAPNFTRAAGSINLGMLALAAAAFFALRG